MAKRTSWWIAVVLLAGMGPAPAGTVTAQSRTEHAATVAQNAPQQAPQTATGTTPESATQPAYQLPPDKLAKAIALSRIRNILSIVGSVWGLVVLWLLLETRLAARGDRWAARVHPRPWVQGLAFFAGLLAVTAVANLPLEVLASMASRHFGISIQPWAGWWGDWAKALGLSLLIGAPVLLLFHGIVRRWPRRYWLGAWMVAVPLMVLAVFAGPLLDPIFNKFEPLQKADPALVTELEQVVARTGTQIPPDRMFLMKASAKTNGLNAYVSGWGATKRVVVWDTTVGRVPNDEILFIFAHETGHYVLHHIVKGMAVATVLMLFGFWACAWLSEWMVRRFGARWGIDGLGSKAGFVVLLLAVAMGGFVSDPISNGLSRHIEHQADVYGQEAIHGIVADPQRTAVAAFNDLGKAWLEDPNPNTLIEFWLYSHPSTQSRAEFAAHYDPWVNGGHGKYFAK